MQRDDDPTYSSGYTVDPAACFHQVGSRRRAFDVLRSAVLLGPPGPILITGEPGAGKTALVQRFAAEDPARWCMASVDLAAEMDAVEFLRLVGHALGASPTSHLGKSRLRLEGALANEAAEGRRWFLVVDRAQRGRSGVWDEVQAIANQLGRSRGFAALFIVGETGLARWLASRRSSVGLVSQVSAHVHLKPLDLDEARDLLDSADVADVTDQEMLEELHRNSHGNMALLLRLAQSWSGQSRPLARPVADRFERASVRNPNRGHLAPPEGPSGLRGEAQPDLSGEVVKEQSGTTSRVGKASAVPQVPALIPTKPPIRDEEGLVEVGWEGDLESENSGRESVTRDTPSFVADRSPIHEELIEDRYAALQAQSELSRNEGWLTSASAAHSGEVPDELPETTDVLGEARALPPESAGGMAPGGIRAEGQHEFAPYSQLFTRYRQSN